MIDGVLFNTECQPTISLEMPVPSQGHYGFTIHLIQPTISLDMPVPSQGHYGFPVVD